MMQIEPCLYLNGRCPEAIHACQQTLGAGGSEHMPLGKTFRSPCVGMLQDRFGMGWMVSVETSTMA